MKFTGKCNWCGKTGHREKHCYAKKRGEPRSNQNGGNNYGGTSANNVQNNTTDSVDNMFAGMTYCQFISEANTVEPTADSWLGDSGATSHITNNSDGMTNKKKCNVRVTVSTGEVTIAKIVGDLKLESKSGEKVKLLNVLYVPSLKRNLLSTNKFTDQGAKLYADNEKMVIKKDSQTITLPMTTENGMKMYVFQGRRIIDATANAVTDATDSTRATEFNEAIKLPKMIDVNVAHGLCHLGEKLLRITFKSMGIKLAGVLKPCDGCCRANAKARSVRKVTNTVANNIGERLFVDTSGPYPESASGNRYWVCIVDDKTRKSWSEFRKSKADLAKIVEHRIKHLSDLGHTVKYLRCDNAGEHGAKLKKVCDTYNVVMEYTAPHTPQMNGVVERRIAVLLNGARAAMYAANLNEDARKKLWAEAVRYTEDVRCSMATSRNSTSSNELFSGKKPQFLQYMKEFGRVGYVTKREKILNKFEERAIKCIFVGYSTTHSGDTYRMYNPETKRIILSRDVKWAEFKKIDPKDNMDMFVKYNSTDIVPGIDESVV